MENTEIPQIVWNEFCKILNKDSGHHPNYIGMYKDCKVYNVQSPIGGALGNPPFYLLKNNKVEVIWDIEIKEKIIDYLEKHQDSQD